MQDHHSKNNITSFCCYQPVIIGMGFSKNMPTLMILQTLEKFLYDHQYQVTDIALPAFKRTDNNTSELRTLSPIPIHYIPQETLLNLQPKCSRFSDVSFHHTGLGAVAEACALALMQKNGRLLIPKIIYNKISFSVAIKGDPL